MDSTMTRSARAHATLTPRAVRMARAIIGGVWKEDRMSGRRQANSWRRGEGGWGDGEMGKTRRHGDGERIPRKQILRYKPLNLGASDASGWLTSCSPSPRPSPLGRGSHAAVSGLTRAS